MILSTLITSKHNKFIKLLNAIKKGKEADQYFYAEGVKLNQTLFNKFTPEIVFIKEGYSPPTPLKGEQVFSIQESLLEEISELDSPQPIIAIYKKTKTELPEFKIQQNYLVLDRIQDPGNVGTLLRTAAATGWNNIICIQGTVSAFCFKCLRASAGSITELSIYEKVTEENLLEGLNELKDKRVFCTSSHIKESFTKQESISSESAKFLILGNEGQGVSDKFLQYPNVIPVKLPIVNENVESLNVSVAGAVLMYKLQNLL